MRPVNRGGDDLTRSSDEEQQIGYHLTSSNKMQKTCEEETDGCFRFKCAMHPILLPQGSWNKIINLVGIELTGVWQTIARKRNRD